MSVPEQVEQKANLDVLFMGMAERGSGSHLVVVAAADPFLGQIAPILQLGDYPLCGASSDAGHVTPSNIGVLQDEDQDSGVVR